MDPGPLLGRPAGNGAAVRRSQRRFRFVISECTGACSSHLSFLSSLGTTISFFPPAEARRFEPGKVYTFSDPMLNICCQAARQNDVHAATCRLHGVALDKDVFQFVAPRQRSRHQIPATQTCQIPQTQTLTSLCTSEGAHMCS